MAETAILPSIFPMVPSLLSLEGNPIQKKLTTATISIKALLIISKFTLCCCGTLPHMFTACQKCRNSVFQFYPHQTSPLSLVLNYIILFSTKTDMSSNYMVFVLQLFIPWKIFEVQKERTLYPSTLSDISESLYFISSSGISG